MGTVVFFDVGGTLVRRVTDPVQVTIGALEALGVPLPPAASALALQALAHVFRCGCYAPSTAEGERGLWRAMATACLSRLPAGPRAGAVGALAASFASYAGHYQPIAGMPGVVGDLAAAGRPVGIISNWPPSLAAFLQEKGLGPFSVVACSGPLRQAKPGLAIFRWALERAGVAAAQAWHVGNDLRCDYRPAEAAGMRAVLWDPGDLVTEQGVVRARSIDELRALLDLAPAAAPSR